MISLDIDLRQTIALAEMFAVAEREMRNAQIMFDGSEDGRFRYRAAIARYSHFDGLVLLLLERMRRNPFETSR